MKLTDNEKRDVAKYPEAGKPPPENAVDIFGNDTTKVIEIKI